jgi:hypothetical protein
MLYGLPLLDVGGVLAMPIYSILSTGTCFGVSIQSCLDSLLTLFGPRPTLSISLSLRVRRNSAKLTTSNSNESLNDHHHAQPYILRRGWLLSHVFFRFIFSR